MSFLFSQKNLWSGLVVGLALLTCQASQAAEQQPFDVWLSELKQEARSLGISSRTIDGALSGVRPSKKVVSKDRGQPEYTKTFWKYLDNAVADIRIKRAQKLLSQNKALLNRVEAEYGVQPRFLMAFWGLESNFGDFTGGFSVVRALVTLAYDARRSAFFREQLLEALKILDQGHISLENMTGSWAGAMGQVQFIPSTFNGFAVDFDGDGRRDIWNSLPDIFASAANYLRSNGWRGDLTWGREVQLPNGFAWELADIAQRRPLAEWQSLGVRKMGGGNLPAVEIDAALVLPGGHKGPAFLVYDNFHATLEWNKSIFYALAIGHLADRIAGQPPLRTRRPAQENPLLRSQVQEIQSLLNASGHNAGTADGLVGRQTRVALRAFQKARGLPADGFATLEVLRHLRQASTQ